MSKMFPILKKIQTIDANMLIIEGILEYAEFYAETNLPPTNNHY